jgi:hypothetical protein
MTNIQCRREPAALAISSFLLALLMIARRWPA